MKHVLYTLAFFTLAATWSSADTGAYMQELEVRSEWWPERVVLVEDFTYEVDDESHQISAGSRGMLIRIEQGEAIMDFGRDGIRAVPVDMTDIPASLENEDELKTWEESGHILSQISNKFFWPDNMDKVLAQHFVPVDYLFIVYQDVGSESGIEATDALMEVYPDIRAVFSQLEFVTIPLDETTEEVLPDLKGSEPAWPVMLPFLAPSYTYVLHHDVTEQTGVLMDKNGKVLARLDEAELCSPETVLRKVTLAIREDESLREKMNAGHVSN